MMTKDQHNPRQQVTPLLGAALLALLSLPLTGCRTGSSDILAHTSTVIGADISQGKDTQTPKLKAGYARDELAIVPTNRRNSAGKNSTNPNETNYRGGARDSANVLMEIHSVGMLENLTFGADIYQRLAVGDIAVTQPGAAFMLAKDKTGELDQNNADAIKGAVRNATVNLEAAQEKGTGIVASIVSALGTFDASQLDTVAQMGQATDLLDKPSWDRTNADAERKRALIAQRLAGAALDPENLDRLIQLRSLLKLKFSSIDWEK